MSREQSKISNKCYSPSDELVNLMTGLHNLELDFKRLDKKEIEAEKHEKGKRLVKTKEIDQERQILKKRKRALDAMKTRVLNKDVFPSMANLTVFLEFMLVSPYLHKTFERDLRSLLFAQSVRSNNKDTIFGRFIEAVGPSLISVQKEDGTPPETIMLPDFRFILWEIMMQKIWKFTPSIGEHKFKNPTFLHNVLYEDIGRAVSWVNLLAHEAHDNLEFDKERRPALF